MPPQQSTTQPVKPADQQIPRKNAVDLTPQDPRRKMGVDLTDETPRRKYAEDLTENKRK